MTVIAAVKLNRLTLRGDAMQILWSTYSTIAILQYLTIVFNSLKRDISEIQRLKAENSTLGFD